MTSRFAFWFLLAPLFWISCGRDPVGQGLTIHVVSEIRVTDPFSGEIKSTRQPASGATVFLVPANAPRPATGTTIGKWPRRPADDGGTARFPEVEGRFRAVVDGNGDGMLDAIGSAVASGGSATIVIVTALDMIENTLRIKLDNGSYHRGERVKVTLTGKLVEEQPVGIEIWRESAPREKMATLPAQRFSGAIMHTASFVVGDDWPFTPGSSLDDYLVVPVIEGTYFTGARFSLREVPPSVVVSGMSVSIDGGALITNSRNTTLTLTAVNAASMSFSENPFDFDGGTLPKYPYTGSFAYQLSVSDGTKTVWTMFYDVDGNYAGPVSDSIVLDTSPASPVTNLSLQINGGVTTTTNPNVMLTLGATGAVMMAVTENPAMLPDGLTKYFYSPALGFQLSDGDGPKTVWAMFYDAYNHYYGPVSATIELDAVPPLVSGISMIINDGDAQTLDRSVALSLTADHAVSVAVTENPALFPNGVTKYAYEPNFGFRLSAPVGRKTVWVMFYDEMGGYAGPISDTIVYDPQPAVPITNMSISINGGDTETNNRNVVLTFAATNAAFMAITEDPAKFPDNVVRYGFQPSLGFQMSATEGTKTLWVMYYDQWGNAAAPVSDSINFDTRPPFAPMPSLMYVIPFAPGMHDFIAGYAGAVSAGNIVRVYSDPFLTNLLAEGLANADGSFDPLDIGDGSAGNVYKPNDWVFVTATNIYDNTSLPSTLVNDSTPPELRETDVRGYWFIDTLGSGFGNPADALRAYYMIPADFAPATDAVGGTVDFSKLGGPGSVTMIASATEFAAFFTLPPALLMDKDLLYLRMQIVDAAFNYSAWVTSGTTLFSIDTIAPGAPVIPPNEHSGGNQTINVQWKEYNLDSASYNVMATDETGLAFNLYVSALTYCSGSTNSTRSCFFQMLDFDLGASFGIYNGRYPLTPLPNCHWYDISLQVVDDAGNLSPFSNSVSDLTAIPPPSFSNWSGLMEGLAMIAFGVEPVPNATGYELDFSTATGAPYEYEAAPPAIYSSPYTTYAPNLVMRFPGLPTNTTFFVSARSVDSSSGSTCHSAYAAEATTRTELVIRAYADGASRETIGGSLATIRDLSGDGIKDILVGSPFPQYVATVSGGTGEILSTFGTYWAPDSYDIPGTPIATAQLNADGPEHDEFIIGSPLETVNGELLAGRVRIYDNDQTTVLQEFTGASLGYPSSLGMQLGFSVANVGDQGGDAFDEFAMGGFNCIHRECGYIPNVVSATEGPGRVILIDGATLTPKAYLENDPVSIGDYFGIAIAGGKNFGGSSAPDFAVGAPGSGYTMPKWQVTVYDGATLAIRKQYSFATNPGTFRPGAALSFIDDVSGDGKAELIIGVPSISSSESGYVVAAGSDGTELWRQYGAIANAGKAFGTVLATGGDVNGDGIPDVVVGAPLGQQNFFYGAGSAYVLDGLTGRFLYEFHGWGNNGGFDGSVGQSALIPGNLILGPNAEWVVGAPGSAYSGYQSGRIYILSTDP